MVRFERNMRLVDVTLSVKYAHLSENTALLF